MAEEQLTLVQVQAVVEEKVMLEVLEVVALAAAVVEVSLVLME
jgi:hypothetical protein